MPEIEKNECLCVKLNRFYQAAKFLYTLALSFSQGDAFMENLYPLLGALKGCWKQSLRLDFDTDDGKAIVLLNQRLR